MKRTFAFVLLISFLLIAIPDISCADQYRMRNIAQTNMTITFPYDWHYLDKDAADTAIGKYFGKDSKTIIEDLLEEKDYFIIFNPSFDIYFRLNIADLDFESYTNLASSEILKAEDGLKQQVKLDGNLILSSSVKSFNLPFYKLISTDNDGAYYYYHTVFDKKEYTITGYMKLNDYTDDIDKVIDKIIKSITLGEMKSNNASTTQEANIPESTNSTTSFNSSTVELSDSYKMDYFFLMKNPMYVYTTHEEESLSYAEQFIFEHDYHAKCFVYYDGFMAVVYSYPKHYKNALTENECLAEIINVANGGFGTVTKSITANSLGDYAFSIVREDLNAAIVTTYANFYLVHSDGIVDISSNHVCTTEKEKEAFLNFLSDLLEDIAPLEKMQSAE